MRDREEGVRIVIGIDPDVDGSGVGILNLETKEVSKAQMKMPQLVEYLRSLESVGVIIEAGWYNHGNYHLHRGDTIRCASKKGENIGRNHEVSKIIGEFCEHYHIKYRFVKPLAKCYHGKDGKISHDELMELIEERGYHMEKCRTNQETRDAIRLAVVFKNYV